MQVFSLQHRTSKRYLAVTTDGTFERTNAADATTWDREGAEQAHMALGSFAGCWKIVESSRPLFPTGEPR